MTDAVYAEQKIRRTIMYYISDETVKNINKQLKPCPFCGSKAKIDDRYHSDEGYTIYVGCTECFCRIKNSLWFDFNKTSVTYNAKVMIKEWNTRY